MSDSRKDEETGFNDKKGVAGSAEDGTQPAFYSEQYFLYGCAGAADYRDLAGSRLDAYQQRVLEIAAPREGETILDLGCGRGEVLLDCLRRGATVWGLDFSDVALRLSENTVRTHAPTLRSRVHLVQADAAEVDLPSSHFDCVLTSDFVEHVPRHRLPLVMDKVLAALRPGGRFVVHTSPTLGYMLFGQFVARGLELLRGQKPAPLETFDRQLRLGGHCSIQSVRSLRLLLRPFEDLRVWAEFSARKGPLKEAVQRFHLTPLLAHHLFAIGRARGADHA